LTSTIKPSAASRSAIAAPIPRDAPVTIATLLVCVAMVISLSCPDALVGMT
jgi:hypothetical protein